MTLHHFVVVSIKRELGDQMMLTFPELSTQMCNFVRCVVVQIQSVYVQPEREEPIGQRKRRERKGAKI